jgi:DNA-binding beta-propeller fold protein YncE
MRSIVFLVLVAALAATAFGQTLEKTIWLPDSFGGMRDPDMVLYNPGNNTVFVTGRYERMIAVLDGVTGRKVARIDVGSVVTFCYNHIDNKLYCACSAPDVCVYVIDAAGNRVLSVFGTPRYLERLCYNPTENKVYGLGPPSSGKVFVIDCDVDSVVAEVDVGTATEEICCYPEGNKVYCTVSDSESVAVIDCSADTLIKYIFTGQGAYELLYNPVNHRVYLSEDAEDDVVIIDTELDTIANWIPFGYHPSFLAVNTTENKVYVADEDDLYIVCGYGDTTLGRIATNDSVYFQRMVFDTHDDLLFCGTRGSEVAVVDGAGDSLVGLVPLGHRADALAYNPPMNRVYAVSARVSTIDGATRQVVDVAGFWFNALAVEYCRSEDKVYCAGDDGVVAIDALGQRVVGFVPLPFPVGRMEYATDCHRLYCGQRRADGNLAAIIDTRADTLRAVVEAGYGPHSFAYRPLSAGMAKMYCAADASDSVYVLAADRDSVMYGIEVRTNPIDLVYAEGVDRVFSANETDASVSVVDCAPDTVVATICPGAEPYLLGYAPGHERVFVGASASSDRLYLLDARSLELETNRLLAGEPLALAYCATHDKVYCSCDEELLYGFSVPDFVQLCSLRVDDDASGLVYDSALDRLYCLYQDGEWIMAVDCRSDTFAGMVELDGEPFSFAWAPDQRRLFVSLSNMSQVAVINDSLTVGLADRPGSGNAEDRLQSPTLLSGVLRLEDRIRGGECRTELFDITGRRVMDLKPGENDIRRVAPGVYFVRRETDNTTTKVVVQR